MWQINSGDLTGGRETVQHLPSQFQQDVLASIGIVQLEKGELDAALRTVSEMQRGWSDYMYYALAVEFHKRGNDQKAHELAKRIVDKNLRRLAEHPTADASGLAIYDLQPIVNSPVDEPPSPCDVAVQLAKQSRYDEAYNRLRTEHCECGFFALVYAQSHDVPAAETALQKCDPNPSNVSDAMADLSKNFAAAGDIPAVLRFADDVRVPGAYENGEEYLAPALRDIAHAWVKKDGADAVLNWARSRPTGYERAMALLGIAESIAPK